MRICDRCRDTKKRSARTLKDHQGTEIELCTECNDEFVKFLNPVAVTPVPQQDQTRGHGDKATDQNKSAGKSAKR